MAHVDHVVVFDDLSLSSFSIFFRRVDANVKIQTKINRYDQLTMTKTIVRN